MKVSVRNHNKCLWRYLYTVLCRSLYKCLHRCLYNGLYRVSIIIGSVDICIGAFIRFCISIGVGISVCKVSGLFAV